MQHTKAPQLGEICWTELLQALLGALTLPGWLGSLGGILALITIPNHVKIFLPAFRLMQCAHPLSLWCPHSHHAWTWGQIITELRMAWELTVSNLLSYRFAKRMRNSKITTNNHEFLLITAP